jgi:hypothetical protein
MKRFILAGLLGGSVFATVLGLAAAMVVTGGGAQSGNASAICDADGVNVTYQDTDSNGTYDQATVTDVECSGTVDVRVEGHDAAEVVLASGSNPAGVGPTVFVALADGLTAAEVLPLDHTQVNVVQTGP